MGMHRWSVGELARVGGVTVRALHYYDEIGLVSPSERTATGHRRYTGQDVRRFHRVRALSRLGFSLDEIRGMLTADDASPTALLTEQPADLDARAARIAEAQQRVRGLLDRMAVDRPEPFLSTVEQTEPVVAASAYLTEDQRQTLDRRATELGPEAVDALRAQWLELVGELRTLQREGTPPGDARVLQRVTRWQEIGTSLRGATTEDGQLAAATTALWRDNRDVIDQALTDRVGRLDAGDLIAVVEYLRQARQIGSPQ